MASESKMRPQAFLLEKDHGLAVRKNGKRKVVVVIRDKNGRTIPATFSSEGASLNFIKSRVEHGTTAAAAVALAGIDFCRRSTRGEPRAPVCGMGICFECRAEVDGVAQVRTCQVLCRPRMAIVTDAG